MVCAVVIRGSVVRVLWRSVEQHFRRRDHLGSGHGDPAASLEELTAVARPIVERVIWCTVATADADGPRDAADAPGLVVGRHPADGTGLGPPDAGQGRATSTAEPSVSCFYWDPAHDTVAIDADAAWVEPARAGRCLGVRIAAVPAPVGFDPAIIWPDGPEQRRLRVPAPDRPADRRHAGRAARCALARLTQHQLRRRTTDATLRRRRPPASKRRRSAPRTRRRTDRRPGARRVAIRSRVASSESARARPERAEPGDVAEQLALGHRAHRRRSARGRCHSSRSAPARRGHASGSAKANCPGAPGSRGGSDTSGAAACSAVVMNGLSSALRHTISRSSPPDRVAARRFVKASTASSKNMTPKRETTVSKPAGSKWWRWASATTNRAATPCPLGALAGGRHHRLGDVDARARAARAEPPRQRHGRGAGAAADVEHATADVGARSRRRRARRSSGRYSSSSTSWSSTQLRPPRAVPVGLLVDAPVRVVHPGMLLGGSGCAIWKTLPDGSRTIARRSP